MTSHYGVDSPNAVLTEELVTQARIYCAKGPKGTLAKLARGWGISSQTLRNACCYLNWKQIPPPTDQQIAETPMPDWLGMDGLPPRPHCGQCVHWGRNCTIGIPEAGGFFASACAAFYDPLATNQCEP
jgi:hypothetical protein